jgi:hypothetical protein
MTLFAVQSSKGQNRRGFLSMSSSTLISFRVGAEDARYLSQEFYAVFNQDDLVNLPAYNIYQNAKKSL